jgi:ATP-binding protein involved in chromosome partitioning
MTIHLSVVSGKGGVGKSTVAANLAVALASAGVRVGLIDADIYGFSQPSLMEIREEPRTVEGRLIPPEKLGVRLMSSGFLRPDNQPVTLRGPMLGRILRTFLRDVEWGELDVLLFDMPPGTGDIPLDLHDLIGHSHEIVVTTPHETAAEVAFRAGAMTARTGHSILGVVENMAYIECPHCRGAVHPLGDGGGTRLAEALRCPLLLRLPMEPPGANAPARGLYRGDSAAGRAFRTLAGTVLDLVAAVPPERRPSPGEDIDEAEYGN